MGLKPFQSQVSTIQFFNTAAYTTANELTTKPSFSSLPSVQRGKRHFEQKATKRTKDGKREGELSHSSLDGFRGAGRVCYFGVPMLFYVMTKDAKSHFTPNTNKVDEEIKALINPPISDSKTSHLPQKCCGELDESQINRQLTRNHGQISND